LIIKDILRAQLYNARISFLVLTGEVKADAREKREYLACQLPRKQLLFAQCFPEVLSGFIARVSARANILSQGMVASQI